MLQNENGSTSFKKAHKQPSVMQTPSGESREGESQENRSAFIRGFLITKHNVNSKLRCCRVSCVQTGTSQLYSTQLTTLSCLLAADCSNCATHLQKSDWEDKDCYLLSPLASLSLA